MNAKTFAMRRIGASLALALALGVTANAWADSNAYTQRNLVSDGFVAAEQPDPDLVNPWGIAFNPFGFVWVADNHTGLSTLYDGDGIKQGLVVQIPTPTADTATRWNMQSGHGSSPSPYCSQNAHAISAAHTRKPSR